MECFFALLCLISYLSSGSSQTEDPTPPVLSQANQTNSTQPLCSPVDSDHICLTLPARTSLYQYPQLLPNETEFSTRSVAVGFLFLDTVNPPADPHCVSALKYIACLVSAPPCSEETGLLLSICPGSCLAYTRVFAEGGCNNVFAYGRTLQEGSDIGVLDLLISLLLQFNCSNIHSYNFYDDVDSLIDPNSCTDVYTDNDIGEILSRPNQCVAAPSTICDTTHGGYYIPLFSRNDSSHLQLLENLHYFVDENCTAVILYLGCFYLFPPCDPATGNALPFCMDLCEQYSDLVEYCVFLLTAQVDSELVEFARAFNCSNTDTYFPPFVHVDNTSCINNTQFGEMTPQVPEETVIAVSVVAGATLVALLFLILVTVLLIVGAIFLYWRRHTGSQDEERPGYKLSILLRRKFTSGASLKESLYATEPGGHLDESHLNHSVRESTLAEELCLSEADRLSYEKTFSSILVPYASLTVGEEIGQGAFGKVYHGRVSQSNANTDIAIKTIKNLSSRNEVETFLAESFMMKDFHHPNVLGLAGVCFDTPDGVPYILLPFMANGSLKDYLKKKRVHVTDVDTLSEDLSIAILVKMCLDIANGMQYLATMKFVHRDLAARNCMIDTNLVVKVGDFGLARDIYTADYYRANKEARLPVKWMPPETLHDGISNEKTDVWSYGVTCWEVFSLGRTPYPGVQNQDVLKHISSDQRLERPSLCPKLLYEMVMFRCWKLIPEDRPTFSELAHQLQEYWDEEHAYVVESLEAS